MKKHSFQTDLYERNLQRTLVGYKPVFRHSDLQRKKVIVYRDTSQGLTVGLIDWEEAGWLPDFWESFTALQGVQWDNDWS